MTNIFIEICNYLFVMIILQIITIIVLIYNNKK